MYKNSERGGVIAWIIAIIVIILLIWFFLSSNGSEAPVVNEENTQERTVSNLSVRLENLSGSQVLSKGVIIIHDDSFDFDFTGELAPAELESLAEVGEPEELALFASEQIGVEDVIIIDTPIEPGQSDLMELPQTLVSPNTRLTIFQMAVMSNDGYVFFSEPLDFLLGSNQNSVGENHDAGFEENTELGSGFDGGQPDPARGEENIENGTPTEPQAEVKTHDQLTEDLLGVRVISVE